MEDFTLYTNKRCFFCWEEISHQHPSSVKQEPEPCATSFLNSLYYLSRHLRLDIGKVFNEESQVPSHLLAKVKRARLRVELCAECTRLNDMFCKLCQKLEKIEMEVASCVSLIQLKLTQAPVTGNRSLSFRLGDSYPTGIRNEGDMLKGTQKIVEVLRSDILGKCTDKIAIVNICPRVKVQRLTMKQVDFESRKIKLSSKVKYKNSPRRNISSDHGSTFIPVGNFHLKIEAPVTESNDPLQDDEMGSTYFADDDHDPLYEDEGTIDRQAASASVQTLAKSVSKFVEDGPAGKMYTIHGGKYYCTGCPNVYSLRNSLYEHYKSKHRNVEFKCCGKVFATSNSLNRHRRVVHRGVRNKCGQCSKMFTQKHHLKWHIQSVHFRQKATCPHCFKCFSSDINMKSHVKLDKCRAKMK